MKKIAILFIMFMSMAGLTACVNANANASDTSDGNLKMDGENIILEVKNNKTKVVLWSNVWEGNDKSEAFPISLEDLKKEDEYVVCLTGRKINYAALEITFDSSFVQERAKPLR